MDYASSDNTPRFAIEDSAYLEANAFESLVRKRIQLKVTVDRLKAEIDGLNLEMAAMLQTAGVKTIFYTMGFDDLGNPLDYAVSYQKESSTWNMNQGRLREAGVADWQIAASMVEGKPRKPTVSVRRIGEAEDKE